MNVAIVAQGSAFGGGRAPLVLALVAGIITAFNPCGFAMLPGYVSYFVGQTSGDTAPGLARRLLKAGVTGSVVTAGFMTVFGAIGLVANQFLTQITSVIPYVSMVVGSLLAVLGLSMVRGFEPKLSFLKVSKTKSGSGLSAMYVYGLSYAVVSLSCGFGGFTSTVISAANEKGFFNAMRVYVAFSGGMGLVMIVLSFAVAFAQQAFVKGMRKALPYVNRASGGVMILTGLYVAYYGFYEWQTIILDRKAPRGPVAWVQGWSSSALKFFNETSGATLIALAVAIFALTAASLTFQRRKHISSNNQASLENQ